ncbi:uncharacterized protein [Watersipora subatra]|uniref:uncharacterized protein n=1 Tax=Watersipora subatra TaxID=2589382 RepID=UPI00355B1E16
MAKFNPPAEFDFVPKKDEWSTRWGRFRSLSQLDKQENQLQIDGLLYTMGSKSETIFNCLGLSTEDKQIYTKVKEGFDKYFSPRKYVIFERATFFRRDQLSGESVEKFISAINHMVDRCDFGDRRSEQIKDRIVVGIADKDVSRGMQKMELDQLTEEKAVAMVRQADQVERQMKLLSRGDDNTSVDAIHSDNHQRREPSRNSHRLPPASGYQRQGQHQPCKNCGYYQHSRGSYLALRAVCRKCSKIGHFLKVCLMSASKPKPDSNSRTSVDEVEAEIERVFLGKVQDNQNYSNPWMKSIDVHMGEPESKPVSVKLKLDTGADVSVIPRSGLYEAGG